MIRHLKFLPIVTLLVLGGFLLLHTPKSFALSGSDWQAGRIIDDPIFTNSGSMSVQQIQAFLDQQINAGGGCDTWGTQPASDWGRSDISRAQFATQVKGWPAPPYVCLNEYYEVPKTTPGAGVPDNSYNHYNAATKTLLSVPNGISAAQIIYNAAQQYQISPKVLLVKIQTESAGPLTQDTWPLPSQYTYALGSNCPDSGPNGSAQCDPTYSGFSMQVYSAASLLRYYLTNMQQPWWTHAKPYQDNTVLWNTTASGCGGGTVHINNMATAALYTYTPYQPNAAALAKVSNTSSGGTGNGCSAYGNRNFWWWYNHWFGSTQTAPTQCDAVAANVACVWELMTPEGHPYYTSSIAERDYVIAIGWSYIKSAFYVFNASGPNLVPIYRLHNDTYGYVWTASTQELNTLVEGGWVSDGIAWYAYNSSVPDNASIPVYRTDSSNGHGLYLANDIPDSATNEGILFRTPAGIINTPSIPADGKLNVYRLWNGDYFYTTNFAEVVNCVRGGWKYDTVGFSASATTNSSPVYRLSGWGTHMFTASTSERDYLSAHGWVYEGIGWYGDTSAQIFRLSNGGNHFYTADVSELAFMVAHGWTYESLLVSQDSGSIPVMRLSSRSEHFFTTNPGELSQLIKSTYWQYEGIGWYASATTNSSPVYRLSGWGTHMFTASTSERDYLSAHGWVYEGIGWYGN